MKLTRRFAGHMRLHRGAIIACNVMHGETVVGTMTTRIDKKTRPWTYTTAYQTADRAFDNLAEFKAAIAAKGPKP